MGLNSGLAHQGALDAAMKSFATTLQRATKQVSGLKRVS
jgi:hypothetical protein